MEKAHQVRVYIFETEDGRTPEERLKFAVAEYCRVCGPEDARKVAELLHVARTEKGKPYFPNCPRIQFSISHSGAYWACAVAGKQIGMDLQEHVRAKNETREGAIARFRKMAGRFFHPTEARFVERDCYNNFFAVWTAREAYVKFTGQGIDKYFSEHCVVPEDEAWWPQLSGEPSAEELPQQVSGSPEAVSWQAAGASFQKTQYPENYTLCVCTEAPCECRIIDCYNI